MLRPGSVINFTRKKYNDGDWQGIIDDIRDDGRYSVKVQEETCAPKYFAVDPEDIEEVISEPEVKEESNGRRGQLEKSIAKHEAAIAEMRKQMTTADPKTLKQLQSKITAREKVIAERRKQIVELVKDEVE